MRILITGSHGMLGQKLAPLLSDDFEVYGCGLKSLKDDVNYTYDRVDLTHPQRVRRYLRAVKPHVIFHLAAKTQVDDCESHPKDAYLHNSEVTKILLASSRRPVRTSTRNQSCSFEGPSSRRSSARSRKRSASVTCPTLSLFSASNS